MIRWPCIAIALWLAGCSTTVQPDASQLARPPRGSMTPPSPLTGVKANDDSYQSDSQCSASYVTVSKRLVALQGWAATVLKN